MIGDICLIHSCTIITRTQTSQDEYGSPVYTETSASSQCRFFFGSTDNSKIITSESGEHVVSTPMLILPSGAPVEEGKFITSTETGFSKTYKVTSVKPICWMLSETVHHYECDMEAVE